MRRVVEARLKIGMEIRSTNPHAFHSGKWGEILDVRHVEIGMTIDGKPIARWCYRILWPDGFSDEWAIEDPSANYEFRGEPLTFTQHEVEDSVEAELELYEPDAPVEPAPRHQWRLEHASSRSGLEMAGKVRVVCKCGWKGKYNKDAPEAVREFEEHESQEKDILF